MPSLPISVSLAGRIRIINEQDLEFQFKLLEIDYKREREYVLSCLSKYCNNILEENGIYYLEK